MNKSKNIFYLIYLNLIIFITLNVNSSCIYAKDDNQIRQIEQKILEENNKLSALEKDIQNIDRQIAQKSQLITKSNTELKSIANQQNELYKEKKDNLKKLATQKKILNQQLQTMYFIHKNSNLQKFAKINNIEQLNRFLNYLESYNQYSNNNISEIKLAINKIEKLDDSLKLLEQQQKEFKRNLIKSQSELVKLKESNITLVSNLQKSLSSNQDKINSFKNQYQRLDNILSDNYYNNDINSNSDFTKFKGKLALPVSGIITTKYKDNKSQNTVFIKTPEGKPVRAIYNGSVVFSNWLRGFGYLTIIDHGDGFMSLYGNNETLYKKTGDLIEAGEIIATTGASGGIPTPGLYFEIRHNGTPADTVAWFNTEYNTTA